VAVISLPQVVLGQPSEFSVGDSLFIPLRAVVADPAATAHVNAHFNFYFSLLRRVSSSCSFEKGILRRRLKAE
jgi:hypothetical protein